MTSGELSQLESAVLQVFHTLYGAAGFPPPEDIRVKERRNTGGGRYVELVSADILALNDGYLDMGGHFVEMEGVPNGLMAVVSVSGHKLDSLEFAVYGEDPWDGEEREWSIA